MHGPDDRAHVGGPEAAHGLDGRLDDTVEQAPPTGVGDADHAFGTDQGDRRAIGGQYGQGDPGRAGHRCVGCLPGARRPACPLG